MILYSLRCDREHEFEGWFRSSGDYDRSAAAGGVACPVCGSTAVEKAMMAPAVKASRKAAEKSDTIPLAAADPRRRALIETLREMRRLATENADYVGDRFAEEARKIHYRETEPRGIYGEATREEARTLLDEGIEFHPLPTLPEDGH